MDIIGAFTFRLKNMQKPFGILQVARFTAARLQGDGTGAIRIHWQKLHQNKHPQGRSLCGAEGLAQQ